MRFREQERKKLEQENLTMKKYINDLNMSDV